MRVLISGFEPFGGRDLNPTSSLIKALQNNEISYPEEMQVDQVLLPVSFKDSFLCLQEKIHPFNPDVVMCFGQAAGRSAIELETVAVNKLNAEITDNKGHQPQGQLISETGPSSYLSTLPLQGMETALKEKGIAVKLSNSAGEFVCNYLFYRLMETNQDTLRLCGFIHVPLLPEQAGEEEPSLPLEELKKALSTILWYINY